jgi:hypothetical protein
LQRCFLGEKNIRKSTFLPFADGFFVQNHEESYQRYIIKHETALAILPSQTLLVVFGAGFAYFKFHAPSFHIPIFEFT